MPSAREAWIHLEFSKQSSLPQNHAVRKNVALPFLARHLFKQFNLLESDFQCDLYEPFWLDYNPHKHYRSFLPIACLDSITLDDKKLTLKAH